MHQESFDLLGYKTVCKIAEGGFGEVYLALKGNTQVAIKRLRDGQVTDPQKRILFENEIQILRKLYHPNIPRFIDSYQSETESFLVMEYFDALNLASLLEHLRQSKIYPPPAFVFDALLQLCSALKYLHTLNENEFLRPVIHCDVKPKNILLTRSGRIILIDFTVATQGIRDNKQLAGTYLYMPPELFTGEVPSVQSDVYATAATFYELLMLRPLVKEGGTIGDVFSYLLTQSHIEKIRRMNLIEPLESFLLKGLAFHQQDRFSSAEELELGAMQCIKQVAISIDKNEIQEFLSKYLPPRSQGSSSSQKK